MIISAVLAFVPSGMLCHTAANSSMCSSLGRNRSRRAARDQLLRRLGSRRRDSFVKELPEREELDAQLRWSAASSASPRRGPGLGGKFHSTCSRARLRDRTLCLSSHDGVDEEADGWSVARTLALKPNRSSALAVNVFGGILRSPSSATLLCWPARKVLLNKRTPRPPGLINKRIEFRLGNY